MRYRSLPLLLLALLPSFALAQGDPYPDTPAGRAAQTWFTSVRSGNPDRLRDLIENHFDPDFRDRVGIDQHLARHTALASAGINAPHSLARATDHDITLYLRDGGVWGELRISVNPQPPHAITNVAVRPSDGPPEAQGRPTSARAFKDETTEFLDALKRTQGFEGAVLITRVDSNDQGDGLYWRSADVPAPIPMEFILDAIKLITPLTVLDASWEQRHPPESTLEAPPALSALERSISSTQAQLRATITDPSELAAAIDSARAQRHATYQQLADSVFSGDSPAQLEYQRGLINTLVLEPFDMHASEVPLAATGRLNPADLARFARALITPRFLPPALLNDITTGTGPDLDPAPTITRRRALLFEERIDNGVRSFSLQDEFDGTHALLRCYPSAKRAVVILAQDAKTLDLIDRRIFNRLPGLDSTPDTDD